MSGYGQFCPVSKAAEVVCQRWTPLIVRELLLGSKRFNEIRKGVPTCSPALLSKRLKELERAGVVNRIELTDGVTYELTAAGRELYGIVAGLGEWGQRWARSDYGPDDLDPGLLLWDVRRFLDPNGLGDERVVVQIVFRGAPTGKRHYWVVADCGAIDLCLTDPGLGVDAVIDAELRALTQVWMGDIEFRDAIADNRIQLKGPRRLIRRIPSWFGQHPVLAPIKSASAG
jgi:DNA-binding HxlR family transcriptional regulator